MNKDLKSLLELQRKTKAGEVAPQQYGKLTLENTVRNKSYPTVIPDSSSASGSLMIVDNGNILW